MCRIIGSKLLGLICPEGISVECKLLDLFAVLNFLNVI